MSASRDFVAKFDETPRTIAEQLISIIEAHNRNFGSAVKWGQLTFGLDNDLDHWICAISVNKKGVNMKFHFGSLLDDKSNLFTPDDSKFIRKIKITSKDEINEKAIKDLLDQAVEKLPYFKEHWKELAKK